MRFSVYASNVLFVNILVDSATGAGLNTVGWLILTRQGLSPRKICRVSLGATTSNSASRTQAFHNYSIAGDINVNT